MKTGTELLLKGFRKLSQRSLALHKHLCAEERKFVVDEFGSLDRQMETVSKTNIR